MAVGPACWARECPTALASGERLVSYGLQSYVCWFRVLPLRVRKTVNVKPEDVKTASACEWGIGQILQEIKLEKPGAGATRTWFSLWSPFGLPLV